ncbi:uncharacterized protein [Ptychodera flava]|uniref:uncharacterized protein n=1 Tax=Ptychodera flava TaxID=63121 RepID=UPI003969C081
MCVRIAKATFFLYTASIQVFIAAKEIIDVRLVNGQTPYDGQVEMYVSGYDAWLPVIDKDGTGWTTFEADVTCRELGFPGEMSYGSKSDALTGDERLHVDCPREASTLEKCTFNVGNMTNDKTAATVKCNYDGYVGCFQYKADTMSELKVDYTDNMTIHYCLEYCRNINTRDRYENVGLNGGNGCYCLSRSQFGNYERMNDQWLCDNHCFGDASQVCGSDNQYGLYEISMGACGGRLNGNRTIYSPGFPGNYPMNQSCSWILHTSPEKVIRLNVVMYHMAGENDTLAITETVKGRTRNIRISNSAVYSCSNLVHITFSSQVQTNTSGGAFAIKFDEIVPDCKEPLAMDKSLSYDGTCPYFHGDVISITCDKNHKLGTSHRIIGCKRDGQWNDTIPTCAVIDCGDPGNVENADRIIKGDAFTYNSTVEYNCHDGYHGDRNGSIFCTETGDWTVKPKCIRKGMITAAVVTTSVVITVLGAVFVAASIYSRFLLKRKNNEVARERGQNNTSNGRFDVTELQQCGSTGVSEIFEDSMPQQHHVVEPAERCLGEEDTQSSKAQTRKLSVRSTGVTENENINISINHGNDAAVNNIIVIHNTEMAGTTSTFGAKGNEHLKAIDDVNYASTRNNTDPMRHIKTSQACQNTEGKNDETGRTDFNVTSCIPQPKELESHGNCVYQSVSPAEDDDVNTTVDDALTSNDFTIMIQNMAYESCDTVMNQDDTCVEATKNKSTNSINMDDAQHRVETPERNHDTEKDSRDFGRANEDPGISLSNPRDREYPDKNEPSNQAEDDGLYTEIDHAVEECCIMVHNLVYETADPTLCTGNDDVDITVENVTYETITNDIRVREADEEMVVNMAYVSADDLAMDEPHYDVLSET